MSEPRILTVIGARPQFIKAAPVSRAFLARGLREDILHTGQHYDDAMSEVFFRQLGVPAPLHRFDFGGLSHGAMTGRMLEAIEGVLRARPYAALLVYGDTNSTLAGALAASKLHVPVVHVEAGMRSFNRRMPEETNRVLTDHVATLNLVSTPTAVELLAREGITEGVHLVGDVMLDASLMFGEPARTTRAVERFAPPGDGFGLVTVHRAENTDDPARLRGILEGLRAASELLPLVFPVHPRTRALVDAARAELGDRVKLVEPVGYLEMLDLERASRVIVTDSGGVQKEALFHGVPCVTLRDETEWVETVTLGWNRLVGSDAGKIREAVAASLAARLGAPPLEAYGGGEASAKVAELLARHVAGRP